MCVDEFIVSDERKYKPTEALNKLPGPISVGHDRFEKENTVSLSA